MESVLITGASGFIGSFLIEGALQRGLEAWAGIRASSSRKYLSNPDIHFLELDFSHLPTLCKQLQEHAATCGKFDYVVHCAGATKCTDKEEFERVNFLQTKQFVDALRESGMTPRRFVFISTLSVFGPVREQDYQPIQETDCPQPNTAYGQSKLKAEQYLQSLQEFPCIILRPTGVYGPRERDYFLMAKSIQKHIDVAAGYRQQDLTFVYVKDVVQATFLAMKAPVAQRAYFLSDGKTYDSRTFSELIRKELGNPFVLRLKIPLIVLKIVSLLAEQWGKLRGKSSTLNSDKYNIMKQRNWQCDITPAIRELGYHPEYDLERGVKETIDWYKKEEWL